MLENKTEWVDKTKEDRNAGEYVFSRKLWKNREK